jgi:hypothetical protein
MQRSEDDTDERVGTSARARARRACALFDQQILFVVSIFALPSCTRFESEAIIAYVLDVTVLRCMMCI